MQGTQFIFAAENIRPSNPVSPDRSGELRALLDNADKTLGQAAAKLAGDHIRASSLVPLNDGQNIEIVVNNGTMDMIAVQILELYLKEAGLELL